MSDVEFDEAELSDRYEELVAAGMYWEDAAELCYEEEFGHEVDEEEDPDDVEWDWE